MSTTVTKTVPFHTFSAGSQEEADALALASARAKAEAALDCVVCPEMDVNDVQITSTDEDWNSPAPGYKLRKFPFSAHAGQHVNIFLDALDGVSGLNFYLFDSSGNALLVQINVSLGTIGFDCIGFDITTDGDYSIGIAAFDGPPDGLPRTLSFHTTCETANVPCILPAGLNVLDWTLLDYSDGDITVGTCTPEVSAQPAWTGTFLDFSTFGDFSVWDADGTNFPSLFSIDGQLLGAAEVLYRQCNGGMMSQGIWFIQIYLGNAFEIMWCGYKLDGNTPVGTYVHLFGCADGPDSFVVLEL